MWPTQQFGHAGQPSQPGQPWQPVGGPPPSGSRSSLPWPIIGVAAAVAVLVLIGGIIGVVKLTSDDDKDDPAATGAKTPAATRTTDGPAAPPPFSQSADPDESDEPSAGPAKYGKPTDVCGVDLSSMGDYAKTKEKSTPSVRETGGVARADCELELRSAAGVKNTVSIKAWSYESAEEARQYFDAGVSIDKSRFDADITDLGEKAYGTNRDQDLGVATSEYAVRMVDSNVYLSIIVVTFGKDYVAKDILKPKAIGEAKAVLGMVPKA
jgi:hypothetical protein